MLPKHRIQQSGLRKVIDQSDVDHLIDALQKGPETPLSTNQFSKDTENLLKSGSIIDAAHLISGLAKKQAERTNGLHIQDRNFLQKAKQFIASELIVVKNISEEQAYAFIDEHLPSPSET